MSRLPFIKNIINKENGDDVMHVGNIPIQDPFRTGPQITKLRSRILCANLQPRMKHKV